MTMQQREQQLATLGRLAGERVRQAVTELGHSRGEAARQAGRLQELEQYLDEYRASAAAEGRAASPVLLANQRAFLARLQQAVEMQTQVVDAARARESEAQGRWQGQRQDARRVETLLNRVHDVARIRQLGLEQKMADDQAAQRFGQPALVGG